MYKSILCYFRANIIICRLMISVRFREVNRRSKVPVRADVSTNSCAHFIVGFEICKKLAYPLRIFKSYIRAPEHDSHVQRIVLTSSHVLVLV